MQIHALPLFPLEVQIPSQHEVLDTQRLRLRLRASAWQAPTGMPQRESHQIHSSPGHWLSAVASGGRRGGSGGQGRAAICDL